MFKPKILLEFLKSNPGATNALTDFLKSKKTDKIFSWANEIDTRNPVAIEGKIGSLPLELKETMSKEFLDYVVLNLEKWLWMVRFQALLKLVGNFLTAG